MIHHSGHVEVICGSMFCGKTEELIRRVRRALIARQTVQVFKPNIDVRYELDSVVTHTGQKIDAQPVRLAEDILTQLNPDTTVVAIDEVQFLNLEIVSVIEKLANSGLRIIIAGLDLDFRAEPFGAMPALLAMAEEVTKLRAICVVCGEHACRSQRLVNGQPARYDDAIILVGAHEAYEARCRQHHLVPGSPYGID